MAYSVHCEHCGIQSSHYYVHRKYVQGLLDRDGWNYFTWHGWYCREHVALGKELASVVQKQAVSTESRRCVGCGTSLEGEHHWRLHCKTCADKAKLAYGAEYARLKRQNKIVPTHVRRRREAVQ